MNSPQVSRPRFPEGYLESPKGLLDWPRVSEMFSEAIHYWLCNVSPGGAPHVIPKWGVWVSDHFYFDGSPQTRHARNIILNPAVAVHLESAEQVVILNGRCRMLPKPDHDLALEAAAAYTRKYAALGYSPQPDQWENGGLFEVTPGTVLAWTKFTDDPTKFTF